MHSKCYLYIYSYSKLYDHSRIGVAYELHFIIVLHSKRNNLCFFDVSFQDVRNCVQSL